MNIPVARHYNDTSIQSQSERDKTVAGNEGGLGEPKGGESPMTINFDLLCCPMLGDEINIAEQNETGIHFVYPGINKKVGNIMKKTVIYNWDDLPVVLDLKTVALCLNVSEDTVINWMKKDQIKGVKIGRKWSFDKEYIKSIIQVSA